LAIEALVEAVADSTSVVVVLGLVTEVVLAPKIELFVDELADSSRSFRIVSSASSLEPRF